MGPMQTDLCGTASRVYGEGSKLFFEGKVEAAFLDAALCDRLPQAISRCVNMLWRVH